MIGEYSDDRRWWKFEPVPKWVRVAMYEGKYGFGLHPECIFAEIKVEIKRIRIPLRKRTLMEMLFAARQCWQVQVWEIAEGYKTKRPTWYVTLDPECSRQDAEKQAERVRGVYRNWQSGLELQQCFRPAEPRVSLPPEKPTLVVGKQPSVDEQERKRAYEIQREERAARFQVLKTVLPKTAELTEEAELADDPETKRRLEQESVEAYFAENAPGWAPLFFKAWQRFNPIGLSWMKWLYLWDSRQMKRPREVNVIDYEMAFNWTWNGYFLLTAEQLKDAIFKNTKQLLSADAIKTRRVRLGLSTQRHPGPEPRV